jgi:phage terminase large subunit-like protein
MADSLLDLKLKKLRRLRALRQQLRDITTGDAEKRPWSETARPEQLEPGGDWFVWLILAGRGWGKSRTAAEFIADKARRFPFCRIALVASTIADARDTMVEGESGLLTCLRASELRGGSVETSWNRSLGELYLANGSRMKTYSSEKPRKLRGPQFHFGWGDESCFWTDAAKGTLADTTWSNFTIATRLPRRPDWPQDYRTQIVVATTPRPVALLRVTDPSQTAPGLMQRENVIITRGRTVDNLDNLSESYKANVIAPLLGTQLGRQELDAEILENREGALWRREWLDADRRPPVPLPDMVRVVIGVDPAVTSEETSDLTGIIVAGADRSGHGYVLADYTIRGTPLEAMQKVVWAYKHHEADRVVGEVNNGGDYIGTVLKTVDPDIPFRSVRASRGKEIRAEPVSALYEQHRVHHLGVFPFLEDQMCTWAPIDPGSPDRIDALVWAFYDLKDLISGSWLDAFGVVKCFSCGKPFLSTVDGVPRSKCPHCNASLEAA